jgi:uncharacterized protein (DUF1786 family)
MQILAVDVGTGTQDVLLFDTEREPENAFKLVMPSPTVRVARAVREATRAGEDVLLTGVTMGGGPSSWAVEDHLRAGGRVYATPDAARTLNDDLTEVSGMGVQVVGEDEASALAWTRRLTMLDYDSEALDRAMGAFGIDLALVDLVAIAVFDHGAAPPGVSDRLYRFEYLAERLETGLGLAAFAFTRETIPHCMTRLRAAVSAAPEDRPVLAMDTAPAAVLGALEDPVVAAAKEPVVANVGNMHTLAFRLRGGAVMGLFEHHTGQLTEARLQEMIEQLSMGTLRHEDVFAAHGHGALVLDPAPGAVDLVAVTGPRRALLAGRHRGLGPRPMGLRPHMAVPHGDMMMAGCWGLVRAAAQILPWTTEAIVGALGA